MSEPLFELCKEVYERFPEWNDTLAVYEQTDGVPLGEPYIAYPELERKWGLWGTQELKKRTPIYTSDYLLEKLPRTLEADSDYYLVLTPTEKSGYWYAAYSLYASGKYVKYNVHARSPLKALLKLVIALDDAGVKL